MPWYVILILLVVALVLVHRFIEEPTIRLVLSIVLVGAGVLWILRLTGLTRGLGF